VLEFVRSKTHPKNIFFINAQTLKDKVDLGALLSRYSRSDKDAETLYQEEFVTNDDRGKEFYAKVFGQYGDESISELVPLGFAVCLENIPILWSTYILHYRTLSAIEKSTRYVKAFDYYKPKHNSNATESFNQRSKQQIQDYNLEIKNTEDRLIKELKITDLTNKAVVRALRARALDECRTLLPLSTFTSIGIMSNLRSWLNILTKEKVRNESSLYVRDLIDPLITLFKDNFPSIFSQDKIDYLVKSENIIYSSKLELQIIEDDEFVAPHVNKVENFELIYTQDIGTTMDYFTYI
jgi:thymidylate synthase ThyX